MQFAIAMFVSTKEADTLFPALHARFPNAVRIERPDPDMAEDQIHVQGHGHIELLHAATCIGAATIHPPDPYTSQRFEHEINELERKTECIWCGNALAAHDANATRVQVTSHGDWCHSGDCLRQHILCELGESNG